ncbi:enoyl-CoA hydratase-related protein, partial [Candidatus Kryptobacter tengchongensis]
ELLKEAEELAKTLTSKPQIAVRMAIKAINMAHETTLSDGLHLEATLFGICCGTEDFKEGTSAFLEKRKPVFKNK